jgi:hypothetical protein
MRFDGGTPDGGVPAYDAGAVTFSSTVPRELVHRWGLSEVFMTDIRRVDDHSYIAGAQWPRLHTFYHPLPRLYDSALIVESLRQATILTAHSMEGVPLGQFFLLPEMAVHALDGHSRDPGTPTDVHINLDVDVLQRTPRGPAKLHASARFYVNGNCIATGTAGARVVDPSTYARMRLRSETGGPPRPTVALPPEQVGQRHSGHVVIGESARDDTWPLHVDQTNPIMFDHPLDHVPGALLLEATRQALRAHTRAPHLDFVSFNAVFLKIVELDDSADVSILSMQSHHNLAEATAEIRVDGEVRVVLSCAFELRAKSPGLALDPGHSDGQASGSHPFSTLAPVRTAGSTTYPQSVRAHPRVP